MGKQASARNAQHRREYQEQRRREYEEKQRRQNRIMWGILGAMLAVILLIVSIPLLIQHFSYTEIEGFTASDSVTDYVRMSITYTDNAGNLQTGDIVVKLAPDIAPITVQNFQDLVSQGFYDGLTFHRVINNFMIQGGDPEGDGTGGSGKNIKGEFSANGVQNGLLHTRGVISMARGSYSYDSASSQFFIVHKTSTHLDGQYAAFGNVVYGMDVVDAIAALRTDEDDKPLQNVMIQSMTFVNVSN